MQHERGRRFALPPFLTCTKAESRLLEGWSIELLDPRRLWFRCV